MKKTFLLGVLLTIVLGVLLTNMPLAYADQGSFTNSDGSASGGSGILISGSTVASPAGTLSMNCPATSVGNCAGGSLSFASNDGTNSINAVFTSGRYAESCSGGGKDGTTSCYFSLTGYISGTWIVNGMTQAIIGVTYQSFPASGTTGTVQGTTAFNSAYAPFYYSDSESILRSDDLLGTNQISYNGAALGGFSGAYGLALDAQGRIYIADTYKCRIVRIDDMNGTNAISYGGTCGSGTGQFHDPSGIAVDSAGKIYIMDTGNSRFVRIDNMRGHNWTTYGAVGSGVGQFASFVSVALDSTDRIYISDTGNKRIVRIDDMSGANWTTLTQSPTVNGASHSFYSPVAVAVDSADKIYVADNEYLAPAVVRVDDMTGLNWTSLYVSPAGSTGLNSISVDSGGTVFTGGGGVRFVDGMAGVLTSSGAVGPIGSYYVFGVTPHAEPSPRPSAISFSPSTLSIFQSPGTASAPQSITVNNFGGSPLSVSAISASGAGFAQTNGCLGTLTAGSTCTVNVTFTPTAIGTVNGTLSFTDNSGNLGSAQSLNLTGTGTGVALLPSSLNLGTVNNGKTSSPKTVTLTNYQNMSLNFSSVVVSAGFAISSNNCGASIGAGAGCTVGVTFSPTTKGTVNGTLTFNDDAATSPQTVSLTGTGR